VEKIRKWVGKKERIDRKENIVLKGISMLEDIEKEKIKRVNMGERINKKKARDGLQNKGSKEKWTSNNSKNG